MEERHSVSDYTFSCKRERMQEVRQAISNPQGFVPVFLKAGRPIMIGLMDRTSKPPYATILDTWVIEDQIVVLRPPDREAIAF